MRCKNKYPTNFRRVANAAMSLKSLGPVSTASLEINVAEIALHDGGSVLCQKGWFRAAVKAIKVGLVFSYNFYLNGKSSCHVEDERARSRC